MVEEFFQTFRKLKIKINENFFYEIGEIFRDIPA